MAHIFQINTSSGGLPKLAQQEAFISDLFVGEDRHNYKGHGGPDAAVCLFSLEAILALQAEGNPVFPGALGENLTISGMDWAQMAIGTKLKIGDGVMLEITDFATPCSKLEPYLHDIMRVSHKEHPGWGRPYCKVLQTGTIKIGDAVRVTSSEQRKQKISAITLVVRDYDEAIDYFTNQLGFDLVEDTPLEDGKRWVRVLPAGGQGTSLLLAKAVTPSQVKAIGSQTGGRVFLLLQTDDFWRDYRHMQTVKVKFLEAPREESYGTVAVFEDLYGNRWDLIELKE